MVAVPLKTVAIAAGIVVALAGCTESASHGGGTTGVTPPSSSSQSPRQATLEPGQFGDVHALFATIPAGWKSCAHWSGSNGSTPAISTRADCSQSDLGSTAIIYLDSGLTRAQNVEDCADSIKGFKGVSGVQKAEVPAALVSYLASINVQGVSARSYNRAASPRLIREVGVCIRSAPGHYIGATVSASDRQALDAALPAFWTALETAKFGLVATVGPN